MVAMSDSALTGQNMGSSAGASGTSWVGSLNWNGLEAVTLMLDVDVVANPEEGAPGKNAALVKLVMTDRN